MSENKTDRQILQESLEKYKDKEGNKAKSLKCRIEGFKAMEDIYAYVENSDEKKVAVIGQSPLSNKEMLEGLVLINSTTPEIVLTQSEMKELERLLEMERKKKEYLITNSYEGLEDIKYSHLSKSEREVAIQPVRTEPKIGRNEPCPCGSGKKFKKCCGNK